MIARINHGALALTFFVAVGFAFTPLGCGSSSPPAVSVPRDADLAQQLRACAAEHEDHLGSTQPSISFDVHLTDDGDVDSVALRDSTVRDEDLEACMAHALRSLTEESLPLRLSGSRDRGSMAPASRAFFGQEEIPLTLCLETPPCALALGLLVGASFIAVTVYVYVKPKPSVVLPHPPVTLATSMPTATTVPTAVPVPAEAARRPRPNMSRCLDAAAGGDYLWEELCKAFADPADRGECWAKQGQSEQNKRNYCRNRFGN